MCMTPDASGRIHWTKVSGSGATSWFGATS
jgi:hypothetical protein